MNTFPLGVRNLASDLLQFESRNEGELKGGPNGLMHTFVSALYR